MQQSEKTSDDLAGGDDGFAANGSNGDALHGHVVEDVSGIPLGSVVVRWLAVPTGAEPVELGRDVTGDDGAFAIAPTRTAEVDEALCRLHARSGGATFVLTGDRTDGEPENLIPVEGQEMLVRLSAGGQEPALEWSTVGNYLMSNRLLRVDDLARQLAAPSADSPTAAWWPSTRALGLVTVTHALEDRAVPATLFDHDHFVDFGALADADLGGAVRNFRDGVNVDEQRPFPIGKWLRFPTSDTELYRDYLRGVWVTAAQLMHKARGGPGTPIAGVDVLERQLNGRFHQDFRTGDDAPKPAAVLLHGVLRGALVTPRARDGFGVAPANVPAQGAHTDDEHLFNLIIATGVDTAELRNRFRVEFVRSPDARLSAVELNVEALHGLLADTWQSPEEPFAAEPAIAPGQPLIFRPYLGRAPFYLQYEEWLERQRAFHPENAYDIRRNLPSFGERFRFWVGWWKGTTGPEASDHFPTLHDRHISATWVAGLIEAVDLTRAALASADLQDHPRALAQLADVDAKLDAAFKAAETPWYRDRFHWLNNKGNWNSDIAVSLPDRAKRNVKAPAELAAFEAWFDPTEFREVLGTGALKDDDVWDLKRMALARNRTLGIWWLYYAYYVLVPYLRSQVIAATSDYAGALRHLEQLTGYEVGVGEAPTPPGYARAEKPDLLKQSALPYTTTVAFDDDRHYRDQMPGLGRQAKGQLLFYAARAMAPFEQRFFKLSQGEVMLEWADQLYRNDDPSSIRRARELFKGVLFMHGADPMILPHFKTGDEFAFHHGTPLLTGLEHLQQNPAVTSQVGRARLGLWQISQGLNAYGFSDDMVPVLRYKTLKQAADLFATAAKSAQSDFLGYTTRFEQARIESWQTAAMVKKADASSGIAREQTEIAKVGVTRAQEQVVQVNAQIAAKQKEIADADSFFGQAKDFFSGMKESLSGMATKFFESSASGSSGAAGLSGASADSGSTAVGGAGIMAGYAAFVYAGYTTLTGMADSAARRSGELNALSTVALPAAEAQVGLKQREVTIAGFQRDIAAAELDLARTLHRYAHERFLNVDLWNKLTAFAQRLMRRYNDLGARSAWLAERALAFQDNRGINIIRIDYFPRSTRGVTGADRLLLDLAELEANRLQGIRLTTPVKHTVSLARDFPFPFAELKKTGRTTFHTGESALRATYPGTFGYRIRAVTIAVLDAGGSPPRGTLRNLGVSTVSRGSGSTPQILTRFADGLPLSEFRLERDLFVYGLPGETLLQFEGSGFETDWEIELPLAANPKGLGTLTDVLITFDMNVSYRQPTTPAPGAPTVLSQSVAVAASAFDPAGLATLRSATGAARIDLDLTAVPLRAQEHDRVISNLAVLLLGTTDTAVSADVTAGPPATTASITIADGFELSNAGALLGTQPPRPLNAIVGLPVDQTFTVEFDRAADAAALAKILDVVLYVDYSSEL